MNTTTIRERLYDYIRVADDKKIKAIFMMLEDEMVKETKWWDDNQFIDELDKRYSAWESGKEKGYTLSEVEASIAQLKHKNSSPNLKLNPK
ncbi:MAG TPA: hypothetical protein VGW31_00670 [Hanamia sp.]|nr:hypothetical protein [Hanamia sp.]